MSASHVLPSLSAAAVVGIVLALRWAASRQPRNRYEASAARPPWRRTAPSPNPASDTTPSPAPEPAAKSAVLAAEEHVQRSWQQLQDHPDRPD